MAQEAISWGDMSAYFGLLGFRPKRWELQALRRLDAAYLSSGENSGKAAIDAAALTRAMKGRKPGDAHE